MDAIKLDFQNLRENRTILSNKNLNKTNSIKFLIKQIYHSSNYSINVFKMILTNTILCGRISKKSSRRGNI